MSVLDLSDKMVETCSKVQTTYNGYGDLVYGVVEANLPCLFRPIEAIQIANSNREEVTIDGMFWLRPTDGWDRGDIILYNGEYFRIDKLIEARRRLVDNSLQFLKAEVYRSRQVS